MENILRYCRPAQCFEEALPLGNGTLGAMIYGGWDTERISLNHDTLWSGKPRHIVRPKARQAYQESRQLVQEDRYGQAQQLLEQDFTADWSQSYLPLGNLYIACHTAGTPQQYLRQLDLQTATVHIRYDLGTNHFEKSCFVSHPDRCLVMRIVCTEPTDYSLRADSQLQHSVFEKDGCLYLTGQCPTSIAPEYARDTVPTVYDADGIRFAAIGGVCTDGTVHPCGDSLQIRGATELTLVLCIETSFQSFDAPAVKPHIFPCVTNLQRALSKTYLQLLRRHIADYSALYGRVTADFGFPASSRMTDARLAAADKENDLGLVELLYNYGRYLLICASREDSQAANLQGIWNERLFAPWSSNYTLNINTEMNYWPVLMNNLAGLDLPLIELVKKLQVTGTAAARDYYGARGYCAHHNSDLWGHATPVGMQQPGSVRYAFWNMAAGWLCRHVWEHYTYTLDLQYLRQTAYPLMKGAAEFYLDILVSDGDHALITPTTSPENACVHPTSGRAGIARSCAMSQAIVLDLFTNLCQAARLLNIEDAFTRQLQSTLPKLNTYTVGSEGQLLEYNEEVVEYDIHHRHLSHLYGLYPGESITTQSTPALAQACRQTLERRGDLSTGWAMGWRVCLWAKLKDGDRALKLIGDQLRFVDPSDRASSFKGGTYPNLLDAHPPFQIDGNFGVCAGIALLFLQCEDDIIRILPALPSAFRNGSIRGLKAKGNIAADIIWHDGRLQEYSLCAATDCTVTVDAAGQQQSICLKAGIPRHFFPEKQHERKDIANGNTEL